MMMMITWGGLALRLKLLMLTGMHYSDGNARAGRLVVEGTSHDPRRAGRS